MFTNEQWRELDPETMIKFMDFRAKFHKKKAKATAEMKRIPKNGWNDFHKYHYARESDVKDMIREILNENGLSITNDLIQRTETPINTRNGQSTKTDVQMAFVITDTETGYFETYTHDGVTIDNSDKGIYKAYSNTIKYFLMDQFLIPTGDDVEKENPEQQAPKGNGGQNRGQNKKPQNQDPKKQQPFRIILDLEDKLAQLTGVDKATIRRDLETAHGKMGKYKEMDNDRLREIGHTLTDWIKQTGEKNKESSQEPQNEPQKDETENKGK